MSDHPEVPRVTFDDDGESMSVEGAVERFRRLLKAHEFILQANEYDKWEFTLTVEMRPCDCDHDINGRDEYCPLHGDKA